MTTRRRAREVALQVLYEEDINPLREYNVADQFVAKRLLNNKPLVTFTTELLYGVRNHKKAIDQVLSKNAVNWSLKRMTTIDRNILRISAYEILFGEVPGRVSINEAIELAKRYGSRNSSQFVNGILDRILKDHQKAGEESAAEEVVASVSASSDAAVEPQAAEQPQVVLEDANVETTSP